MAEVTLKPWAADDLETLRRSNAPEMMTYLGGSETEEKLRTRHERYLRLGRDGEAHMFRIVTPEHPEGVGVIGYWNAVHDDTAVYETGWSVEPWYQGQGIGTRALIAALDHARFVGGRRSVHAYPRTDNAASNAICAKAGMTFNREMDFEYPPGNPIRCNDWEFTLEPRPIVGAGE
ncbi:GNAT family N-acetyltransferase [Leifsonia flava]|uniref:N-acetyltransferase n=1 Tax=Orlajensenia leifsoniae TaxID=2561933 RepID=A0A4Y9QT02_9MICO|nr:GNAT family N-acetyltransferase [Leifsonia flava]TFV95297.1 N-acetyltransferase [Leifsonia flava]